MCHQAHLDLVLEMAIIAILSGYRNIPPPRSVHSRTAVMSDPSRSAYSAAMARVAGSPAVTPTSSSEDKRKYRVITLENGMRCALVSDPISDKAAASLGQPAGFRCRSVRGSRNDDQQRYRSAAGSLWRCGFSLSPPSPLRPLLFFLNFQTCTLVTSPTRPLCPAWRTSSSTCVSHSEGGLS